MNIVTYAKNIFLELLFPLYCLGCDKTEGTIFCETCRAVIPFISPSCFVCKKFSPGKKRIPAGRTCSSCRKKTEIFAFLSPFSFNYAPLRSLICAFKYNRVTKAADVLSELLTKYLTHYKIVFPKHSILIPIPLYPGRERQRGFNQSRLIAERLSTIFSIPLAEDLLKKTKDTSPQVFLGADERRQNVQGVFEINRPELVEKKTVILLDDVKTTGATLEEAAKVLKKAGANRIWALTLAH